MRECWNFYLPKSILLFSAEHLHFGLQVRDVFQATAHVCTGGGAHAFNAAHNKK